MGMFKHGYSGTRLYRIWKHMKMRCNNPKDDAYKNYGARGITVCREWDDIENFAKWAMENGYQDNLEIDRIDNNGNYCPENCRWVTGKINCRNKRDNRLITINGKTQTLADWAEQYGVSYKLASSRLARGWPAIRVFSSQNKNKKLVQKREFKQLTQRQVANLSGISTTSYQNIEMGGSELKVNTALKIAKVLDINSLEEFMETFEIV